MKFAVFAVVFAMPIVANAANLKADRATKSILEADDELPSTIWRRIVEARSVDGRDVAYFLVFKLHDTYFSYDVKNGSRRIWPIDASARALAHAAMPSAVDGTFVSHESFTN